MGVGIIPVKLDWKHRLDKHFVIAKSGLKTDDFGVNNTLITEQELLGIDYVATFKNFINKFHLDPKSKNFTDQVNAVNIEAVEQGRNSFEAFLSTVFDLDKTPVDRRAWEEAIEDAVKELKHDFYHVIIGGAEEKSGEVIEGLPEEVREPAKDIFFSGFKFVMYFLTVMSDQIDEVVKSLYEILLGIWDRISRAQKAVKQVADGAIQRTGGIHVLSGQATGSQTALHESHTLEEQGEGVKPWSSQELSREVEEGKLAEGNMN